MNNLLLIFMLIMTTLLSLSCQPDQTKKGDDLMQKISQFAETEIKYDESLLDERQKVVVQKLYQAAKVVDELFLEQVYSKNMEIKNDLMTRTDDAAKNELAYFNIMAGPFDRLDERHPFIGTSPQPLGANFYPENMTKEEFGSWLEKHPDDRPAFTSEFTVIRRDGDKLLAIPYSEHYKDKLLKISNLLNEAAEYADNESLQRYLLTRATALHTNDYYESDMAWMDLKDHSIEVIIGPYEVYEDRLFNYKAAFECFITIKDPVESEKLDKFKSFLNDMEDNLPIPDEHKNFNRGSESPMVVVQEVFSAGDTKAGVQTLAFNLPNDERVREAKGSKKVMLKNIHEAKFAKLLMPIAKSILDPEQLPYVTFNGFFNHTLMHEMSHGVGPGKIKLDGRDTEVKIELKETYSKLEECKADVLGMYNNIFMIEKGIYTPESEKEIYITFLPGVLRSIRFGIDEAHGAGNAIIFNYFLEKGIYEYNADTKLVRVNLEKVGAGVKELANVLLMIQAKGDYDAAVALINKYAVDSAPIQSLRAKLKDLPVDIWPIFQIDKN
jgi:hypothetical protein